MELEGASVLVTGGASGIGEACARRLSLLGARPVIADLNEEKGKAVADDLKGTFAKTDVADADQAQAAVEAALALGPLRAVVNAAGMGNANRTVNREGVPFPLDQFEFVIRVNLIGTFNCLRLGAAAMSQQDPCDNEGQRGDVARRSAVMFGGKAADVRGLGDIDAGHAGAQGAVEVVTHAASPASMSSRKSNSARSTRISDI